LVLAKKPSNLRNVPYTWTEVSITVVKRAQTAKWFSLPPLELANEWNWPDRSPWMVIDKLRGKSVGSLPREEWLLCKSGEDGLQYSFKNLQPASTAQISKPELLPKQVGRPPYPKSLREQDRTAATQKPREWCAARDEMGFPLSSVVEEYGSWVNAYDSGAVEIRHYLSVKKLRRKTPSKAARPYKNPPLQKPKQGFCRATKTTLTINT
jgi:hypothetical protein